jgi:hypothetical protein
MRNPSYPSPQIRKQLWAQIWPSRKIALTIHPEAPPPVQLLCKDSPKDGAQSRRHSPDCTYNAKVKGTVPITVSFKSGGSAVAPYETRNVRITLW